MSYKKLQETWLSDSEHKEGFTENIAFFVENSIKTPFLAYFFARFARKST